MDHRTAAHGTARVIEGGPQAEPDVDLAWKQEVDDTLQLADRALSRSRPSDQTEETTRRFLEAGQPARAPEGERLTLTPTSVDSTDGSASLTDESFRQNLDEIADALARVDVETVVEVEQSSSPVRIEYEFGRPVTAVENVHGQLYTLAAKGRRVPFQPGTQTTYLVQIIAPEEYPGDPNTETQELRVRIEGTQATWTEL